MIKIQEFVHELRNKELFGSVFMGELAQDGVGGWAADTCSIQALNEDGNNDFDSGIITVSRANDPTRGGAALGGGVTITAPGLTALTGTEWFKNAWLQFAVTTQSANSRVVRLIVCMKKLYLSV